MMEVVIKIIFFILGIVVGSFYNVVGLRIPLNESIIKPKSHCMRCGHELKWYELIPIFSYLFLRGKCYNCKEKISIIYPLIELATGLLFLISYLFFGFSLELIISITIVSFSILVIISDVNYMIIPDSFIVICSIIIIVTKIFSVGFIEALIAILYGIISFGIMYLIMLLGNVMFKKECLGGADIKLMFIAGLLLNPLHALLVILIASFTALPISLVQYFKKKEHMIPFGPFLVLGMLIVYFSQIGFKDIIDFLLKI